jgi:hypothetical protein
VTIIYLMNDEAKLPPGHGDPGIGGVDAAPRFAADGDPPVPIGDPDDDDGYDDEDDEDEDDEEDDEEPLQCAGRAIADPALLRVSRIHGRPPPKR